MIDRIEPALNGLHLAGAVALILIILFRPVRKRPQDRSKF